MHASVGICSGNKSKACEADSKLKGIAIGLPNILRYYRASLIGEDTCDNFIIDRLPNAKVIRMEVFLNYYARNPVFIGKEKALLRRRSQRLARKFPRWKYDPPNAECRTLR